MAGSEVIVIALGGNALQQSKDDNSVEEQVKRMRSVCEDIADVITEGHSVIIVHGNGPQVGQLQELVSSTHLYIIITFFRLLLRVVVLWDGIINANINDLQGRKGEPDIPLFPLDFLVSQSQGWIGFVKSSLSRS